MSTLPSYSSDFNLVKETLYDQCGLALRCYVTNPEGSDYGACSFLLNDKKIQFRFSKITPTKTGQFVTLWKRNNQGITAPYDSEDELDFVIVAARSEDKIGQFIFPKAVLLDKGIIATNGNGGKRGIRVYPPWDKVSSKQAEKTQAWQSNYFLKIDTNTETELLKKLLFL